MPLSRYRDTAWCILPYWRDDNMTREEELRQQAADSGAEVIDWRFETDRLKGLYCDGVIAISDRIETSAEQAGIIAEELGHHLTASGNILDQSAVQNRKQEIKGRAWAYDRLIGLSGIVKAYEAGCHSRYEMAKLLEVSEEMLADALEYYHSKYGLFTRCGRHVVYFEPLGVMETR